MKLPEDGPKYVDRNMYQLLNKTNVNNLIGSFFIVLTARIPQHHGPLHTIIYCHV
jgi:hypothetical protein